MLEACHIFPKMQLLLLLVYFASKFEMRFSLYLLSGQFFTVLAGVSYMRCFD